MRSVALVPLALAGLAVAGCSGSTPTATGPTDGPAQAGQASLGRSRMQGDTVVMPLGLYTLRGDVATATASLEPKQVRTAAGAGDDAYELCVSDFFPTPPARISDIEVTADSLRITYAIYHPFPAPSNLDGPPTATNRADLGISGKCVFLCDTDGSGVGPPASKFFSDTVICNAGLVTNADAYFNPKELSVLPGYESNTFPYLQLVDETIPDCRFDPSTGLPITNNGSDSGNYNAATGGWQRNNIGTGNNKWTGYGVLHGGQAATRTVDLDLDGLDAYSSSGGFSLDMAIIAEYNDPRGGTNAAEKKQNRLPSASGNPDDFMYKISPITARFGKCVATDSGDFKYSQTMNPLTLQIAAREMNSVVCNPCTLTIKTCIPGVLGDNTVSHAWTSTPTGTGAPSDPFSYVEDFPAVNPGNTPVGTYTACTLVLDESGSIAGTTRLNCALALGDQDVQPEVVSIFPVDVTP